MIAIKCPKCGCEYLPGELYIPKYFLGQPKEVVREKGMVVFANGIDQDLETHYQCDYCDTHFHVKCYMNFVTTIDEDDQIEDYKTKVK